MLSSLTNRSGPAENSGSDSPSDNDSLWEESNDGGYCDRDCIKTRWKNRYRTKTETATTTATDFFVTTETRLYTTTATTTICDKWNRNCGPRVVTKTETKVYPTTVFCPHGCPRRDSMCTRTEIETEIQRFPVPCRRVPCPAKPETTTITKYFPKKIPYPCVITKAVTVVQNAPAMCTLTQTRLKFRRQPQMQCHRKPCGPETITETIVETVTRACVKTKTIPVPTTIAIIQPIIKPIPVRCTVTEVETLRETVTCRAKPCIPSTLTQVVTRTKVQPCIVKETEVITTEVPVTRKFPVMCTETKTKTKVREVPVKCTRQPCKPKTVTEYIPVEVVRTCKETQVVTATEHHHHDHHHDHHQTQTATATTTKHHLRWTTTTKHTVCKVTETETLTKTREKHCVVSCTSTNVVTVTKTKPCVVTETLPIPYPVPRPYPYTKEIPVPYPVPYPVERKPVRPCKEIPCPRPPPCHNSPCPLPPAGPCYEKSCSLIAIPPKPVAPVRRCDDDQCPPTPPGLQVSDRQCDANGVVLHFDGGGLLRDQLNRIGYIADNFQFQFDLPVQAGGYGEKDFGEHKDPNTGDVYLTWRGNADFYKCQSGNFDNLYSQSIAGQCRVTRIMLFHCVAS
jgi:hypothetical protein